MCEHHSIQAENAESTVVMQACDNCSIDRPVYDLSRIGSNHYCADCRDGFTECCNCATATAEDDQITDNNNQVWCRDCYSEAYTICDCCSVELPIYDAVMSEDRHYNSSLRRRVESGPYCQECYDDRFFRCHSCDCECRRDDGCTDDEGNDYCNDCYCERFSSCDECGCTIDNDQAICTDDGTYCQDCAPHDREEVSVPRIAETGFLTKRAFAVELEVIDGGRSESDMSDDGWECCTDGSLQDSAGREYCSGPIGGQKGIDRINRAADHLSEADAIVSKRCGFHLHIDASSESGETVAKFMRLAKRLEQWAMTTQPKSRTTGSHAESYCDKLSDRALQASTENDLEHLVYGCKASRHAKSEKYNQARYHWMNGHSWFYRGTVECRLHAGTVNSRKILEWCRFWLHAFDFAKRSALEQIDQVPSDATGGFWLIEKMGLPVETAAYFAERVQKFSRGDRSRSYDPDRGAENAESEV